MNGLQADVQTKLSATYTTWKPISYKTQVVAGTNWTVVVSTGGDDLIEIKVW